MIVIIHDINSIVFPETNQQSPTPPCRTWPALKPPLDTTRKPRCKKARKGQGAGWSS
jgi:hypothetical protein